VNNLLISNDDLVKISDFGVSVTIDDDDLISTSLGPATYPPPEAKQTDILYYHGKSADLWTCGLTLYHMVFKQPLLSKNNQTKNNDYKY
jgi:serine/threonine protein kinase